MTLPKTLLAVLAVASVTAPVAAMAHDDGYAGFGHRAPHARLEMRERREHWFGWGRPIRAFHEGRRIY